MSSIKFLLQFINGPTNTKFQKHILCTSRLPLHPSRHQSPKPNRNFLKNLFY
uniref:Uncharacterized protein n=1 Tax=Rhizophora mucronata TaxID=61149 RepID=A0A2P2NP45_RHIMU